MSEIVVLRIVLDVDDDVIRDVAIAHKNSLADLHNAIVQAFDLDSGEMSSFFRSDEEFNQGEEISMMDLDLESGKNALESTAICDLVEQKGDRMLYVYDYLNLWTFFIELYDIREQDLSKTYPYIAGSVGNRPDEAPEKTMQAQNLDFEPDDETEGSDGADSFDLEDDWF